VTLGLGAYINRVPLCAVPLGKYSYWYDSTEYRVVRFRGTGLSSMAGSQRTESYVLFRRNDPIF